MKEYQLNTGLLGNLMCVDLNETVLGGELEYNQVIENANEDGVSDYEIKFDTEENLKCVERALKRVMNDVVMPFLTDYGVTTFIIGGWYHPRNYNFECDRIDLTFSVTDEFFSIALTQISDWRHNEQVRKYYDDHFVSRSGFISFCPESLEELFIDMAMTKTNLAVAVYLTILLWQEFGDDKLQTELEDNYVSYEAANTQIAWYEPI